MNTDTHFKALQALNRAAYAAQATHPSRTRDDADYVALLAVCHATDRLVDSYTHSKEPAQ